MSNLAQEKPIQNEQVEGDALSRVCLDFLGVVKADVPVRHRFLRANKRTRGSCDMGCSAGSIRVWDGRTRTSTDEHKRNGERVWYFARPSAHDCAHELSLDFASRERISVTLVRSKEHSTNASRMMGMATKEGKAFPVIGSLLFYLYGLIPRRFARGIILGLVQRLEGGDMVSRTLRRIYSHYHQIDVGLYSGGACFIPHRFRPGPPGCRIGRYCSLALTACRFNANHPTNTKSTHAIFYNPSVGYSRKDFLKRTFLTIGNDVWIGHNAIILSSVSVIGDGAIVGAGAVVHQDVPPYAIVVGNPGRVVRYRFSPEMIRELQESRWWEKGLEELTPEMEAFQRPLEGDEIR